MITFIECKHDNLTARSVITLLSVSMISLVSRSIFTQLGLVTYHLSILAGTIMSTTCIKCCDCPETTSKCTNMLDTLFLFFSCL